MTPETIGPLLVEALPVLRKNAYQLTRNSSEAEDLVQDTVLKILSNPHLYEPRPGQSFRSWAFVIMRNTYLTSRRRPRYVVTAKAPEPPIPGSQEPRIRLIEVVRRLRKLSAIQRTIVLQTAIGCSVREIAAALDLAEGTVKSNVSRSRAFLTEAPGAKQWSVGV